MAAAAERLFSLREALVTSFQERMQIKRSLIELAGQGMENAVEVARRQASIGAWEARARAAAAAAGGGAGSGASGPLSPAGKARIAGAAAVAQARLEVAEIQASSASNERARLALEARLSGDAALAAQSGFDRLETYINDEVATGEVRLGKLRSVCSTTRVVLRDLGEKTNAAMGVVERDAERIGQVQGVLESRKEQSLRQMGGVLYTLSQSYEKAQRRGEELLAQRLTLFQTARLILNKGQWRHGFQQELESQLRDSIQRQIENALELVEADLRSLWQQLHEEEKVVVAASIRLCFNIKTLLQRPFQHKFQGGSGNAIKN
jgi:hypothetical protein